MSWRNPFLATALAVMLTSATQAATIVDYNLTGLSGTTAPATASATTVAAGLTADLLTRGAGIDPSPLANGYSANNWLTTTGNSLANAQAGNEYYQFGFDVGATQTVSITSFDTTMRRSAAASASHFALFASLDDFATPGTQIASWDYLGRDSGTAPGSVTPFQWMTTDTPGQPNGNPISTQVITDPLVQNIASGTSVQFRLYGWGNGTGAATNTLALGRVQGPKLGGDIVEVPEPGASVLLLAAAFAGWLVRRR